MSKHKIIIHICFGSPKPCYHCNGLIPNKLDFLMFMRIRVLYPVTYSCSINPISRHEMLHVRLRVSHLFLISIFYIGHPFEASVETWNIVLFHFLYQFLSLIFEGISGFQAYTLSLVLNISICYLFFVFEKCSIFN